MFPTFDVPPQQAETIKARKARRAKDDAKSTSSGSVHSDRAASTTSSSKQSSNGFGWFGKSKKNEIKEIPVLPSLKQKSEKKLEITPPSRQSSTKQLEVSPPSDQISEAQLDGFPLPPPTKALPSPPPLPSPGLLSPASTGSFKIDPRRRTQASAYSQTSEFSSPAGSIFSRNSRTDTLHSEVSSSSHTDDSRQTQGPFGRALAKMEAAGPRIMSARLGEEWDGLDDDESYQEVAFEKRLWALTAYQRLTQNKQLQSPAHELLRDSRPADQRRILHLYGLTADGWILANSYPTATVYTVSSTQPATPTLYPAPLNHHPLYVPSISSSLPFPDGYFDAIISRSMSTMLSNDEWTPCFFDSVRVLKPGGQMEVLSLDAHISREGRKLSTWVDQHMTTRLEAQDLSMQPSDTVLDTMDTVGLENIRRARVALPAHVAPPTSTRETVDTNRMMTLLGNHFYQELYGRFLDARQGEEWWWERKDIREECDRQQAKMVLTITCARKSTLDVHRQSFLSM